MITKRRAKITDNGYAFLDYGREERKPSFRLWIEKRLLREGGYLELPTEGIIERIDEKNLVARTDREYKIHEVFVRAPLRGIAEIRSVSPETARVFKYRKYESPRGKLGINEGALIVARKEEDVIVVWRKKREEEEEEGRIILRANGIDYAFRTETTAEKVPDKVKEILGGENAE